MKILLDTNIIIHREASNVIKIEIGPLFRWLDKLKYEKCIHPLTIEEIEKHGNDRVKRSFAIKLDSYYQLKTLAPIHGEVQELMDRVDQNENDIIDSKLLNEVYCQRVDFLLTEDRKAHRKAQELGIGDRVYTIDGYLEKITAENPSLVDYKVLAVQKEHFGNIDIQDPFFDSFREDYPGFDDWFNRKADETAYICKSDENLLAFLYLKIENEAEDYSDISPSFTKMKRLKIGTFKVSLNGFKLGERFLKIVFDNAIRFKVDEIYVTIFDRSIGQIRLITLLEEWGFSKYGIKSSKGGDELVYVRNFYKRFKKSSPRLTYPFYPRRGINFFLCAIRPPYHTNLFPDSILNTESPDDFVENEPYRNAIRKVYISRSWERGMQGGDIIVFYRTGGRHKSVITTIGIVERAIFAIKNESQFIELCRKRSVFSDKELKDHWNYNSYSRPFIVKFLYTYSFPKRPNLLRLIDLKVIKNTDSAPRGFQKISREQFELIITETHSDESLIVN